MRVLFVVLTLLCLIVALFALQNPDAVTVRFWPWEFQASVAAIVLGATVTGALVGWGLGLLGRFRRWQRRRPAVAPGAPAEPPPGVDR